MIFRRKPPQRSKPTRRSKSPRLILLGPQRGTPTLASTCADLEADGILSKGGTISTITAGWQAREGELGRLEEDVGRPAVDLGLYARAESLVASDPELAAGHRAVQRALKELRRAYNLRLAALMSAASGLETLEGDSAVLDPEREDALEAIRRLDARHLARVGEIRAGYEGEFRPAERSAVARHRAEIEALLADAEAVVIAGGHVATLLNRLRLFGLGALLREQTIVAWSAGAMALGRRIVLFHDSPPWGPGNAEAFENGLGLFDGLIPFADASRRLALDDRQRTARLARRFAPDVCALLDPGVRLERSGDGWRGGGGACRLDLDGSRQPLARTAA